MKKILIWSAIISCVIIIAFTILGLVNNAKKDEDIKDSPGIEQPGGDNIDEPILENLEAGLYDIESGEMTASFQSLIEEDYLILTGGALKAGNNMKRMRGRLIVSNDVSSLVDKVFMNSQLTEIIFDADSQLKTIGSMAFNTTYNLRKVVLPESLETLGENNFGNAYQLREINIPSKITELPTYSFQGCFNLKFVDLSNCLQLTKLGTHCFYNCHFLKEVILPESLVELSNMAFNKCYELEKINLSNVKTLGNTVFSDCESLTEVDLSNCETIGSYVFSNSGVKHIYISAKVTSVGDYAFQNCNEIAIYCENDFVEFNENWNKIYTDSTETHEIRYGYTYEQYLAEVNA